MAKRAQSRARDVWPATWRNRIVGHGVQPAGQFLAHPDNWRIHSTSQQDLMDQALDTVGWVDDVKVSKRTGYTLDGHMRVLRALARSEEEPIPYTVVDVTEAEEAFILATFDPIASLAGKDAEKVAELIDLIPENTGQALAQLLHSSKQAAKKLVQFQSKTSFDVIVECENETQQAELLSRLTTEGFKCRTD